MNNELCFLLPKKQHTETGLLPKRKVLKNGYHRAKERILGSRHTTALLRD